MPLSTPQKIKPYRLPASPFKSPARQVGSVAAALLTKSLGQRGFAGPEIIAQWATIVGQDLARVCTPDRIAWPRHDNHDPEDPRVQDGATLHIRVDGPAAIEVQHMADQIIDRVNQFFGFIAVSRLRITQAPVAPAGISRPAKAPRKQQSTAPKEKTLSAALDRLGAAIRQHSGN